MSAKMLERPHSLLLRDEEKLGFSRPINRFLREKLGELSTCWNALDLKDAPAGGIRGKPCYRTGWKSP